MKIEEISNSQGKSLMIMFILGTSLLLGADVGAMESTWISMLLAMAMAIPLAFIYGKLMQTFPGLGFFDILQKAYGKMLGKIFILIYTFYFFHLGAICMRNATEYVQVVSLPKTPQYVTAILIGILAIYAINAGFSVLTTWAKIVLPIIILMIFATFILGIPQFNYSYIKPILYNGWKPIIRSAYSLLTFPFAETVIFMVFLGSINKNNKDNTKIYISSILISGSLFLIASFRNILLLGFPNIHNIYFPSHYATSIINILGFVQRIELFISINLLLTSFIKITICLYASSFGIIKLFNLKKTNNIPLLLCALMILISSFLFRNTMEMIRFIEFYKYYAIPFQFVFPILTLMVGLIRKRA